MQKTTPDCWIDKYSKFTFVENTISRSPKFSRANFLGSDSSVLLVYAVLETSRTFFQRLLACLNFNLGSEGLLCLYKGKKWFLWTGSITSSWKPWRLMRIELILTLRAELEFRFRRFILFIQRKEVISMNWQHHKQLKTMEINEDWTNTYIEGCIHQFQPESTHKIY